MGQCNKCLLASFVLAMGALVNGLPVQAAVISSFQTAMQPTTPAPGWAYLWNSGGAIGNPANYTALLPTTHSSAFYDNDGVNGLPGSDPGGWINFGLNRFGGIPGGHPGRGPSETGSGGIERYAIARYTISSSGEYFISNSLVTNTNDQGTGSSDGLNLKVYVNNSATPILSTATSSGFGSSVSFDTSLGTLVAGDRIYVAIGGKNTSEADGFSLQYDIAAVPEPTGFVLLNVATSLVLLCRNERRRWRRLGFLHQA